MPHPGAAADARRGDWVSSFVDLPAGGSWRMDEGGAIWYVCEAGSAGGAWKQAADGSFSCHGSHVPPLPPPTSARAAARASGVPRGR
jgi:hypothetical protein